MLEDEEVLLLPTPRFQSHSKNRLPDMTVQHLVPLPSEPSKASKEPVISRKGPSSLWEIEIGSS